MSIKNLGKKFKEVKEVDLRVKCGEWVAVCSVSHGLMCKNFYGRGATTNDAIKELENELKHKGLYLPVWGT